MRQGSRHYKPEGSARSGEPVKDHQVSIIGVGYLMVSCTSPQALQVEKGS